MTIAPFATVGGTSTGTPETTNTITFGSAVSSVTLTASPSVASATSTYTVTFRATSAVASGGTITLAQPNTGFSGVTGWLITDTTANWRIVGNTAGGPGSITLAVTGQSITAGDALTVTVAGVTNPAAGTYSNFTVATSADTVPAAAPSYNIGPSGAAGVIVTPNPATVGSLSTYTVSNLFATAAFTAGVSQIGIIGEHGRDDLAQQPHQLHDHRHHDPVRVWDSFSRERLCGELHNHHRPERHQQR